MGKFNVLGLMSGTALDGLDLAYCHFWRECKVWHFKMGQCETISYEESLKIKLKDAIHLSKSAHARLHQDYGLWLGQQAQRFLEKHQLQPNFIASHGHTSHHRPEAGITFQLGAGQNIANASGYSVICDFRTLDVELGGQGAPLVPIGDHMLFSAYPFCLNLGGISNISFQKGAHRIAYDVGMANMPLNYITEKLGLAYDAGGKLAQSGKMIPKLLHQLNALAYYQLPYPKSTGYEWFSAVVKPLIDRTHASTEDLLHTIIHHNCEQIARAIKKENNGDGSQLYVTGGGAFNDFFIHTLQEKLPANCTLVIPSKKLIAYKEAMVFAFMGVLKYLGEVNILATVTGAKSDSSSGMLFQPIQ